MADGMDRSGAPSDEADGADGDGAEQAFEALRGEVAALRRGVELVYRQGQDARGPAEAGPDYSPTLGAIAKALKDVGARLDAIERAPTLAVTAADQAAGPPRQSGSGRCEGPRLHSSRGRERSLRGSGVTKVPVRGRATGRSAT